MGVQMGLSGYIWVHLHSVDIRSTFGRLKLADVKWSLERRASNGLRMVSKLGG